MNFYYKWKEHQRKRKVCQIRGEIARLESLLEFYLDNKNNQNSTTFHNPSNKDYRNGD